MHGYLSSPVSTTSTSYSSYSTSPMEIPSSSSSRQQSPSCAYPSWPRRSSLSGSSRDAQSTSFIISDEELFPSVFDEAELDCTPSTTPRLSRSPASPSGLCDMVVTTGSLMRQLVAEEKAKRAKKERRRGGGGKKSRSSSGSSKHMSPILEAGE